MKLEKIIFGSAGVLIFTAFFLFLFFPTIFLGIDSFFYRDYGVLGYPIIHYHKEAFLTGEIPLWNPLSHCGIPFLAQWGTMTLYPLSLFYLFLPLPWSLSMFCFIHLLIGAAGMYVCVRKLFFNDVAAFFSSICYIFNGITLSCLMWPNYTAALAWLPWVIYSSQAGVSKGGARLIYAIVFASFQMLTGVPEIVIITHLITIAFIFFDWIEHRRNIAQHVFHYCLIIIGMMLIASVQLLPFVDLLMNSHRTAAIDHTKWSMPSWGLANFFVPLFHYFKTYQHTFVQTDQAFLTSYYFPLGALALALYGFLNLDSRRKTLFLFLVFFSIAFALGSNSFIYNFISKIVPVFDKIRYPIKFIILLTFIIPVLSGYGINAIIKSPGKALKTTGSIACLILVVSIVIVWLNKKYPFEYEQFSETFKNTLFRLVILFLFFATLIFSAKNKKHFAIALLTAIALIAVDGMLHMPNFHPKISAEHFKSKLWERSVESKKPSFGDGRVYISPGAEAKLLRSTVQDWTANFIGKRLALWSNLNLLEEIPKVNGALTLQVLEQKILEKALYDTNKAHLNGLLKFLNVKWVTKPGTVVEWTNYTNSMSLIWGGQSVKILEKTNIVDYLCSAEFKPEKEVIVDKDQQNALNLNNYADGSNVLINKVKYSNHRIEIDYECDKPSILTIAQTYYKNWRVRIDGNKTQLIRANYAFQAFVSPSGKHTAVIEYFDLCFITGLAISCASVIFISVFLVQIRRKYA
ncbi:MAG: YfhO family protein [Verrucomicrobiae bacterium]|nr:YfhO family protein [Verrucomicrobiae bacterium]